MPNTIRRCFSDVSMIIVRATNSGERAWREEYLKYVISMRLELMFLPYTDLDSLPPVLLSAIE